ncbi:LANO_0F01728g1_1 [Lachancea nothofagi CBS 11611]|uniref:LANO_0F01728g1_1 n=1 Tax=Lachancea nothofagi CBS 11611 TaxID=1266666 RepID=A0A1G4K6E3_9SACH|nr:LANO_0F01728g1_1 [Lachancea nothofagi CBS 11611]
MSETEALMTPKPRVTTSLAFATLVACFGSIQYGYHMAELNAPGQVLSCSKFESPWPQTPYNETWLGKHAFKQCIELSEQQMGLATSIFSIGGLAGSLYAGKLADRYGRKRYSFFNCIIGILGSLILFRANTYAQLVTGRFIVGVCCGSSIVVTPLFISEMSPKELRGSLGSMNQVCINLGILLTQLLALKYADSYRWRWIMLAGAALALINLMLLYKIDESPLWLASQGNLEGAESVLRDLRGGDSRRSRDEVDEWLTARGFSRNSNTYAAARESSPLNTPASQQSSLQTSRDSHSTLSLVQYFTDPRYAKSRWAVTAILMSQQFCGINSIIFYGVKVVSGQLPQYAILVNFAISILNVLVTFGASFIIDHWGRRPLLIASASAMSVATAFVSAGIVANNAVVLVTFTFIYVAVFAIGLGPIPFLVISELSPPEASGIAQSYGTTCNWVATFIVGYGFPLLSQQLNGYVFLLFTAYAAGFAVYVWFKIPETKGKQQEQLRWRE